MGGSCRCALKVSKAGVHLVPTLVHEGLQRHQASIYKPWYMGPFGRALPCTLFMQRCHDTLHVQIQWTALLMTDHPEILYIMPTRCITIASDAAAKMKCLCEGCYLLAGMQKGLTAQSY